MEGIDEIKNDYKKDRRIKICFFVKQGADGFLEDIINELSVAYEIKKMIVTNGKQIDEGMEWADICWFEWCDELVVYGSKSDLAKIKKIVCRIHSYEAFTEFPANAVWENVDKIIFVSEYIRDFTVDNFNLDIAKTVVIPNGIREENWTFLNRKPGYNIAYVGYINYKKGPMLLLHTFKAIYDRDNGYKLFSAGEFQDYRDILYFKQMIKELGLQNNVIYNGWQNDLNSWLEDKNYILCTSILESQNVSIMQAMSKGIKPIIHNFVGAKNIYPGKNVWNTIDEAVKLIYDSEYNSEEYSLYIKNNFSLNKQINNIKNILKELDTIEKYIMTEYPLVTIGITNYNGDKYLRKCVDSAMNQNYPNIEILIVDDCSTDTSYEIIKEYQKNYDNIRSICHNINSGGASKGIQEIIDNARGKYVQWIACDDFMERDAIYRFAYYLEKNPDKDYVYSDLNIVNENNMKVQQWNNKVYSSFEVIARIFKSASGLIPMNCLYRVSFFKDNEIKWIVYRDNDFSADTLNSLQFIKYNWNYGKINGAVINYRIHSNNLSYNLEKRIKASVSIFDYIIKNFNEEVYAPEIDWRHSENRVQLKNCFIAKFYYNQLKNHVSMNAIPTYIKTNVSEKKLLKYCYPFLEEGIKYIEEGLLQESVYYEELLKLKGLYAEYMEIIKNLEMNVKNEDDGQSGGHVESN